MSRRLILALVSCLTVVPGAVGAVGLPGDWEVNPLVAGPVPSGSSSIRTAVFTFTKTYTGPFSFSFTSRAGTYSTVSFTTGGSSTFTLRPRVTTAIHTVGKYSGTFSSGSKLTVTTYQIANVGFQDIWDSIYLDPPMDATATVLPVANWIGVIALFLLLGLSAIAVLKRSVAATSEWPE